jgi:hypothetical protein
MKVGEAPTLVIGVGIVHGVSHNLVCFSLLIDSVIVVLPIDLVRYGEVGSGGICLSRQRMHAPFS